MDGRVDVSVGKLAEMMDDANEAVLIIEGTIIAGVDLLALSDIAALLNWEETSLPKEL